MSPLFKVGIFIGVLFLLLFPIFLVHADAGIKITELMYDPPGVNAGRQWIEIANVGSGPVDLDKWKLVVGDKNHKLKFLSGTSTLPANGVAVIIQKEDAFRSDYPSFNGILIHSAFTLKSEGGAITLKDASSTAIDSVSYDCDMGGCDDGNSLHRIGDSFVARPPTPGVYPDLIIAPQPKSSKENRSLTNPTVPVARSTSNTNKKIPPVASSTGSQQLSATVSMSANSPQGGPLALEGFPLRATQMTPGTLIPNHLSSELLQTLAALGALVIMGTLGVIFGRKKPTIEGSKGAQTNPFATEADEYEITEIR